MSGADAGDDYGLRTPYVVQAHNVAVLRKRLDNVGKAQFGGHLFPLYLICDIKISRMRKEAIGHMRNNPPCDSKVICATPLRVGRKKRWAEDMQARFAEGTFERIAAVLSEGEDRTDFVRVAVENEITKRERPKRRIQHFGDPKQLPLKPTPSVEVEVLPVRSKQDSEKRKSK
ncbi:hypothetical protein [Sphingomonas sp. DT-204]|uniref:hypothetical protein n=1 Tax=Sphingomonas sp. DT-204 TaxID=3396166 RepID=UPI003F1D1530